MQWEEDIIQEAIIKASVGINKYLKIMQMINNVNVLEDKEFQRLFNGFYRIRQRPSSFYCICQLKIPPKGN